MTQIKSEFAEWFVAQHRARTASGMSTVSDQQLRAVVQAGREAEQVLDHRELWDEKRTSALYAWSALTLISLDNLHCKQLHKEHMMFYGFDHAKARPVTTKLLDAAEEGLISWEQLARDALGWMSEADVKLFAQVNDLMQEDEDEDE